MFPRPPHSIQDLSPALSPQPYLLFPITSSPSPIFPSSPSSTLPPSSASPYLSPSLSVPSYPSSTPLLLPPPTPPFPPHSHSALHLTLLTCPPPLPTSLFPPESSQDVYCDHHTQKACTTICLLHNCELKPHRPPHTESVHNHSTPCHCKRD